MLEASVLGLRYHRVLADDVDPSFTAPLKANADYSFVISYGGFVDPDYEVVEKNCGLIHLDRDLDDILASFDGKTRQYVRRAEREPDLAVHQSTDDFDALYRFYSECEHDRGWFPVPPSELRNSLVYYGTYKGTPIAGVSCYSHGKRLRLGRIFSTRRTNDVPSIMSGALSKRLIFDFIKYGKDNGYQTLDLGGIDLSDGAKNGIAQYKLSFGVMVAPARIGRLVKPAFAAQEPTLRSMGLDVT